ncbi:MAG: hypothetical protein [Microviridae sp.]|nr:MAG: hypothetical protein [Microviridae sp.]
MSKYFNVTPSAPSFSSSFSPFPLVSGPVRTYSPHSQLITQAALTDSEVNAGSLVSPSYDTVQTIESGFPNPFTDPSMSELDRFEYALSIGQDVLEARERINSIDSAPVSASTPDPTADNV